MLKEKMVVGYYDLVRLPGGAYIPAPLAVKLIGDRKVAEIPVSHKKRDNHFFYCSHCEDSNFFYHDECYHCGDEKDEKCRACPEYMDRNNAIKEMVLMILARKKSGLKKLRYIRALH